MNIITFIGFDNYVLNEVQKKKHTQILNFSAVCWNGIFSIKLLFLLSYYNVQRKRFSNTMMVEKYDIASWKNVVCSFTFCAQLTYKMKRTRYCGLLFWTIPSFACLLFSHDFATFCSSFWNIINQSFFKNTERDNKCLFCVYHI